MKPIVYLGPSLDRAEAERLIDAEFRPPVRRGDLASHGAARVVVILDGEFGQSFSVSPKEILRSLDRGFTVIGASSMGALRAAELAPFGMAGHGWVYEAYRSGKIEGDDEVALLYSPPAGPAVTVPLVNVRCWLERAQAAGAIADGLRRKVLRRVRQIYFGDRTPSRLERELRSTLSSKDLAALLETGNGAITDVKAEDARVTLSYVASLPQAN